MNILKQDHVEINEYKNFRVRQYKALAMGVWARTFVDQEINDFEDFKSGNFFVPKEAYAIQLSFDKINVTTNETMSAHSGIYFIDGKIYDRENAKESLSEELYNTMLEKDLERIVVINTPNNIITAHEFTDNDFIITRPVNKSELAATETNKVKQFWKKVLALTG
jgi:hypothetical protein